MSCIHTNTALIPFQVCRTALAEAKATIADVTRLRWEVEGRELDAQQQLAAVTAERDDLKSKLLLQQEDSVQVVGALLHLFVIMYLY